MLALFRPFFSAPALLGVFAPRVPHSAPFSHAPPRVSRSMESNNASVCAFPSFGFPVCKVKTPLLSEKSPRLFRKSGLVFRDSPQLFSSARRTSRRYFSSTHEKWPSTDEIVHFGRLGSKHQLEKTFYRNAIARSKKRRSREIGVLQARMSIEFSNFA